MNPRSIGLRLAAWYLAVLFSAMLVFAGGIWLALRSALLHHLEHASLERIAALGVFLEKESLGGDLKALREEAREYASGLPAGHGLRVFAQDALLFRREPAPGRQTLWVGSALEVKGHRLRVEMAAPVDQVGQTLQMLQNVLLGLIPLMLAAAGIGGWWLGRRALKPVDEMTFAAEAVSVRDLSARLAVPRTGDELQRLGEAWNRMLGRIAASVHQMTRFTADAAHELRTPAAIIRSGAELALHRDRSPAEYRSVLRTIEKEAANLSSLIEDLMWLARHDAGKLPQRREPVDFIGVAAEAAIAMDPVSASKGVTISVAHETEGEVVLEGDAASLRRVVLILLDNAIKFSPEQDRVELRTSANGATCRLQVRDRGPGVAAEHLPYVFDRFYRSDSARTTPGAGLGLSIARAIVEQHGGTIGFASVPSEGSVVTVELPLASKGPAAR